jgi:hypothetical protein
VLILVMMLLIGLFAGEWGFLMCFSPARWDKLTEAISFAGRWEEGCQVPFSGKKLSCSRSWEESGG